MKARSSNNSSVQDNLGGGEYYLRYRNPPISQFLFRFIHHDENITITEENYTIPTLE